MIAIQIGAVIFLIVVLGIVFQDEYRRNKLSRKSAKLDRFWDKGRERRRSTRISTEVDVLYEVASGKDAGKQNSLSRNISASGINLALNEKLFPGTVLKLQLNLSEGAKPIVTHGKIVWVKEIPGKFSGKDKIRYFAAGVKFIQVKKTDEAILRDFIQQHLKDVC